MNCTKNPLYKRKATVDAVNLVLTVAGIHFARLLYVLQDEGFGKKKLCEYWDKYVESVNYVSGDRDTAIKRYRMNELLKDVPYITYSRAMNVLDCQSGFAPNELEIVYRDADARSDLIDNIMMSMLTLHYDFGFGERRIARVMTAWAHCNLDDAIAWAEKRTGNTIEASKKDVYDWLRSTEKKQRTATLTEQRTAKAGLEALRRYQQEVRNGKAQHI
jgi:hypothetical protein